MSLDQWQVKLEDHFKILSEVRKDSLNNNPVFALEHGLETSDLERLSADIRMHIALQAPLDRHWFPWIIYAAEIGYQYDGQEYWQTFESRTSGWSRFGYRYRSWIRNCFVRFRDEFGGAEPSGSWAEHFKYICWPIRHAILPHDLQHQLAKALFDLRLFFHREHFESPERIGHFIATHCRAGTKRFLQLLEDPILVGQISVALLLQGHKISEELLMKETQARILADLGREQRERAWLESAQRQAVTTYKGLRQTTRASGHRRKVVRSNEEIFRIENAPRLLLYPKQSQGVWEIKLELQDMTSLVTRLPDLLSVVSEKYCVVAGTNGYPQARGIFLRPGSHRFSLVRWPYREEPLIKFENAPEELDAFLRMGHLFPVGKVHLFKISSDGIGYEVRGKHLRPALKYIVLSETPIPNDNIFKQIDVRCEGIFAAYLEPPKVMHALFEKAIKAFDLNCSKTLQVWPAGLPAKEWDDEGYGVWLSEDNICIGLRADYELQAIQVCINNDDSFLREVSSPKGDPVFLDLHFLPDGENIIEIKAIAKYQPHDDLVGYLTAVIREPQVWNLKTTNLGALKGFVDPEVPSLEEIWGNDIILELFGPAGRAVKCKFRLLEKLGGAVIREKQLPDMILPISGQLWRNEFALRVKNDSKMQEAYDAANAGEILLEVEETGYFVVSGERRSTPIRWALLTSGNQYKLRYINETEEEVISLNRYAFLEPDIPIKLLGKTGQIVDLSDGGLFCIRGKDDMSDTIIITPHRALSLQDMRIFPRMKNAYTGNTGIEQLIHLYSLWAHSRTSGSMICDLWRSQVLKSIVIKISSHFGEERWQKAEVAFLSHSNEKYFFDLKVAISDKKDEQYIGKEIDVEAKRLASVSMVERIDFFKGLFKQYFRSPIRHFFVDYHRSPITIDRADPGAIIPEYRAIVPEFVLRLSSEPSSQLMQEKERFSALISWLIKFPVIVRSARYFVMAVERYYSTDSDWGTCCYRGWKWI